MLKKHARERCARRRCHHFQTRTDGLLNTSPPPLVLCGRGILRRAATLPARCYCGLVLRAVLRWRRDVGWARVRWESCWLGARFADLLRWCTVVAVVNGHGGRGIAWRRRLSLPGRGLVIRGVQCPITRHGSGRFCTVLSRRTRGNEWLEQQISDESKCERSIKA